MSPGPDRPLRGVGWLAVGGFGGYVLLALNLGVAFAIPVGIVGAIATAIALRGPLGSAMVRRLDGSHPGPPPEELYGELDDLRARVGELEERVDFTERLLTQAREENRLAGEQSHE